MSSGPGRKREPAQEAEAVLDDLEDAVAEDVAFHLRAGSKKPADEIRPLHATESLDLEGAGKFDQRLWLHLVELGDGEVGNVGIGPVRGELLRFHLVRSDFARTVVAPLAPISAIAAFRAISAVVAIAAPTPVAVTVIAAAIAISAAEFALPWLGSLSRGIGHIRSVDDGGRGLTFVCHCGAVLALRRSSAPAPRCARLRFLDLALTVFGRRWIQDFLVRQLRSSSSGTVGLLVISSGRDILSSSLAC